VTVPLIRPFWALATAGIAIASTVSRVRIEIRMGGSLRVLLESSYDTAGIEVTERRLRSDE
jgi:hypothetical protein